MRQSSVLRFTLSSSLMACALLGGMRPCGADTSTAFLQMPSRFSTNDLSLGSRGLGEICYSRDLMPDGTACNPAFSDAVAQGFLMGRIYLGNGYSALSTANSLVFQPVTQDFLRGLFQNHNVSTLEAEAGLVFAASHFSAAFVPYRVQYFSEVHNPNLPQIAIQASVERALEFQGGTSLAKFEPRLKDFSVGAKLRLLDRNYVSGSFSLAQTLTDDPKALLPVKQQYAAYLDPTVGWRPRFGKWAFWASAGVVNLGGTSTGDILYRNPIDAALGIGVEPPLKYGRLRLGVDVINWFSNGGDGASMFRLGGSYKLGVLEAMAGWNENAVTGGLLFGFQMVQAGVVYEFVRSELDGGFSENRISTELSIRL